MANNNTAIYVYVVVSLVAIGVLIAFLVKCNSSKQNYVDTFCDRVGTRGCWKQQREGEYPEGLTEYSDLACMQNVDGGPKWRSCSDSY